jgi:hypothetical protein
MNIQMCAKMVLYAGLVTASVLGQPFSAQAEELAVAHIQEEGNATFFEGRLLTAGDLTNEQEAGIAGQTGTTDAFFVRVDAETTTG